MAIVAHKIKASAQRVYDQELKEQNSYYVSSSVHHHNSGSNVAATSGNSIFKKGQNKSNRGLIELTNDSLIFAKLHMWFTWILRACACQITEEFVHGPINEDLQIKIEQTGVPRDFNDINNSKTVNVFDCDEQIDSDLENSCQYKIDNWADLLKV